MSSSSSSSSSDALSTSLDASLPVPAAAECAPQRRRKRRGKGHDSDGGDGGAPPPAYGDVDAEPTMRLLAMLTSTRARTVARLSSFLGRVCLTKAPTSTHGRCAVYLANDGHGAWALAKAAAVRRPHWRLVDLSFAFGGSDVADTTAAAGGGGGGGDDGGDDDIAQHVTPIGAVSARWALQEYRSQLCYRDLFYAEDKWLVEGLTSALAPQGVQLDATELWRGTCDGNAAAYAELHMIWGTALAAQQVRRQHRRWHRFATEGPAAGVTTTATAAKEDATSM